MAIASDLFAAARQDELGAGVVFLGGFAIDEARALVAGLMESAQSADFRHMDTRTGQMSVAVTNCGELGWTSSRRGYRYTQQDPLTGRAWPRMPNLFREVAVRAASAAGYAHFLPDACLMNRYEPGAKLSLHQDRNEVDMSAPVVTISLGLSATFLWGGRERTEKPKRLLLHHGDVMVWGGEGRLNFHGIDSVARGHDPLVGPFLYSLTFRRAG